MAQHRCSAPGCCGLVQTTDTEHRHKSGRYFCDAECEQKYDDWKASQAEMSTPVAPSIEEFSNQAPTEKEDQMRRLEIPLEESENDSISFIQRLAAAARGGEA